MSTADLTGTEAAVLLVLMAEATAVPNPQLNSLGPELKKASRDKLKDSGLIEVGRAGRSMTLELTDKGWRACADLMGTAPPARSSGPGKALFTVLAGLRRWFDETDTRPADIFSPRTAATASPSAPSIDDVEARIRETYARLVRGPGTAVRLSRLRPELSDIPRDALDAALARLRRAPDVSLIPEENQKTLTADDHAAAVVVGNQRNHLIEIEL